LNRRTGFSAGIDESGRGCLLGPLVVAGVSVSAEGARSLKEIGVKDSKLLSAKRRESLYPEITKVAERVFWMSITPGEIDEVVARGKKLRKLNYLEALYFAKVIDQMDAARVTVDAADIVPQRFRNDIRAHMTAKCTIVSRHKADRDFPVVSAASIVAKVQRDREVELLKNAHGDFGSGYPSDPTTRSFFSEMMKRGEPLPDFVRKSWKTWYNIQQSLLTSF
jgi:ribonuclease HII